MGARGLRQRLRVPRRRDADPQEVEKNYRYAIDVAKSAQDPDDPVSPVGRTVPDFDPDEFSVSYGSKQEAAAVIRRSLLLKLMHYRINGGRVHTTTRPRVGRR